MQVRIQIENQITHTKYGFNETDLEECRVNPMCPLRKEVIQPHLPVRLPCYDLARIASSTFGATLPCGLGSRLQAYPTFLA